MTQAEHRNHIPENLDPAGIRTLVTWCKDEHATYLTAVTEMVADNYGAGV